jgi:hypothetical protein
MEEPWCDSPAAHASSEAEKIKYLESLSGVLEYGSFVSNVTFDDDEGIDVCQAALFDATLTPIAD